MAARCSKVASDTAVQLTMLSECKALIDAECSACGTQLTLQLYFRQRIVSEQECVLYQTSYIRDD